jgi:hypothetical protein
MPCNITRAKVSVCSEFKKNGTAEDPKNRKPLNALELRWKNPNKLLAFEGVSGVYIRC